MAHTTAARGNGARASAGDRRGLTLVELLVTLTLLGLVAGVAGLALQAAPRARALDPVTARVLAARDSALRTGHPVTISFVVDARAHVATAFPDGRVLSDAALALDPLSGSGRDAAR